MTRRIVVRVNDFKFRIKTVSYKYYIIPPERLAGKLIIAHGSFIKYPPHTRSNQKFFFRFLYSTRHRISSVYVPNTIITRLCEVTIFFPYGFERGRASSTLTAVLRAELTHLQCSKIARSVSHGTTTNMYRALIL